MSDSPRYSSASSVTSLWQEYRIFDDRLELRTLFGPMTIPFEQIERVELAGPNLQTLLGGKLKLEDCRLSWKLDWVDFVEHLDVDTKEGWLRRVQFTPDDPAAFRAELEKAMEKHRERCKSQER